MSKPVFLLACALVVGGHAGGAQQLPRAAYFDYLPTLPRIVSQTAASARLHLFGDARDSAFRDAAPTDGMDDRRAARLLFIAERFSPIMRRNNFSVPRDLDGTMGLVHTLSVDSWKRGRLVQSESIALGSSADGATLAGEPRDALDVALRQRDVERLRHLVRDRNAPRPVVPAEGETEHVLFFDQPGTDLASWRRTFSRRDPSTGSKVFAHPFIHEVSEVGSVEARYLLVMQYWFFYPFNDAVNTHEGDWEHINVLITTAERAAATSARSLRGALLTEKDIGRILSPVYDVEDSLIIGAVDYYFHQNVSTLDYLAARSDSEPVRRTGDPRYVWEDVGFVRDVVRRRLVVSGGRLATHPVVYIGGDNKGPDELLVLRPRFLASFKRNSGSSYPFPGVWQTVAGFGVTEKVNGRPVPELQGPDSLSWADAIDRSEYVAFRAKDILLLPDWERVEQMLLERDDVLRAWSWLVLPIYWGFPVMRSTGGGLLKHVDLGNVAPMGPAFQSGWNRIGSDPDFSDYEIRVLRIPFSSASPWAVLHNGWGALNVPLAAWGLMPGYNVAFVEIMPWIAGTMNYFGAPPPRTYSSDRLPSRFTSASVGAYVDFDGLGFVRALPRHDPVIATAGAAGATNESRPVRRAHVGSKIGFNLYFGERFSLENSYALGTSDAQYDFMPEGGETAKVSGMLQMRQLTGGLRYDAFRQHDGTFRMFARAGYGWLSYRASALAVSSAPLARPEVRGGYLPPLLPSSEWWPNTWYAGGGIEAFSPRPYYLLHLLGYGLRVDLTEFFNKLTFDEASGQGDVTARRGDVALSLVFGW